MTDIELRELCHQFFDAIERHDFATVEALYHPELQFWFNVTGRTISVEENLAALREGAHRHRRRTYDSRIINTFDTGFVVQYSVNVVPHTGPRRSLSACLVAECRDGRIWRLDEYLDSSKFEGGAALREAAEQEANA